jgi:hypothetical protein
MCGRSIRRRAGSGILLSMRRSKLLALATLGVFVSLSALASGGAPRPYVWLGGYWIDKHDKYGWAYFAQKPGPSESSGPHGGQRPCIAVSALTREGRSLRVSESELCYGRPQFLTAKSEPLIVSKTVFADDRGAATAFGVAASHSARYLKLSLGSRSRTIRLHELNPVQAKKTGLRPFRHAGFVLRGQWCIEQVTLLNGARNVLWDSGSGECPPANANLQRSPSRHFVVQGTVTRRDLSFRPSLRSGDRLRERRVTTDVSHP